MSLKWRDQPNFSLHYTAVDVKGCPCFLGITLIRESIMNNPIAFQVAGAFFLLLSLADLLRFIFKTKIIIGSFTPPLWMSLSGCFVWLAFATWIFTSIAQTRKSIINNPIAFQVAGAFFLLLSLAALLRFIFKTKIIIGSFAVPLRMGLSGCIVYLALAIWIFKSIR
jgi:hypothetical protein